MTGFGSVSADTEIGTLQIELRAVNSRFLDFYYNAATDGFIVLLEPKSENLLAIVLTSKEEKSNAKFTFPIELVHCRTSAPST